MNLTETDVKRFWSKVAMKGPQDCWEWQAARLRNGGYGAFRLQGQTKRAHRIAYFLSVASLDPSLEILHLCDNPACCNPAHLTQDTHQANLQQAGRAGTMVRYSGANSKKQFNQEQLTDILTAKVSARALGRKYRVDHKTIRSIQKEFVCQIQSQSQV